MPIVKLPSGEYVNVADGTTPERMQQIVAENSRKPRANAPARQPGQMRMPSWSQQMQAYGQRQRAQGSEAAETQRRVDARKDNWRNSTAAGHVRDALKGYTFGFDDEIQGAMSAATGGVVNAIRKGDLGEIGREYRVQRDTMRQEEHNRHAEGGIGGTVAEIAGALASPVGLVGKGLKAGAGALGITRAASALPGAAKVAQVAARASQPVAARAALAGAGQGALNGLGVDESGTVGGAIGNTISGATVGGVAGGVLGTAAQGLQRGVQVIRDRSADRATTTAYSRIADLLGKAPRTSVNEAGVPSVVRRADGSIMTHTPESAARELAVANGRGSDTVVGDLSNGLQILSGKTARNAESMGSNAMVVRSEGRMANRPQEVEDQIAGRIQPRTGTDVVKFQQSNTAARKAAGQRDYDAVLDKPIVWTPELDQFVTKPNPLVRQAMQNAERMMRSQDIDPRNLGLVFGADGVLQRVERPTMRTFDYMKRGLDQVTRSAKDAKDFDAARIAGEQVDSLRGMLGKVNPEYTKVLATQRSYFQQDAAAELGKSVVARLQGARADPRQLLQDIGKVHPDDRDALRTGFADALISLRDTKTAGKGPVAVLQAMTRSPNQRKVLENLFEGRGNLGRFERWLGREVRAAKTDAKVAGPQSVTSENMMNSVVPGGDVGSLAMDTLRGVAYGGPTGAIAAGIRKLDNLANSTSQPVNDEIARILMSRGEDLVTGVNNARAFQSARKAANRRRATRVARGAQQPFTDTLED